MMLVTMMMAAVPRMLGLAVLLGAGGSPIQAGGLEEEEEEGRSRPYAVLKAQNLVLLGSIFSILLMAIILLAVCVYKPIRRR